MVPVGDTVVAHLDKSHVTVHTYPEYHPDTCLATFRVDIDVATCGAITPLSTLDYLIGSFDSDIITMDYRVRGFTRDVTGCKLDIDERRTEIEYRDKDGERQSFNPKRYAYSYDFYIVINVNNPYFSEIRFQLNSSSVDNDEETLLDGPDAMRRPRGALRAKVGGMGGGSLTSNAEEVRSSVEYRQYEEMGCEIRDALLQVRQQAREEAAAAAAPKAAVTCPYCGATTTPDASGCCEFCGGATNG